MILDAGSSAKEDPASAVPFDLKLPNGKVLRKPGNLFNLTEGMLWGTLPAYVGAQADLDGDGRREFGEVLPEANAFKAAADAFVLYAGKLDRSARAWKPTASDAFTSVVVMVPTMSEYFGQWKTSRFVLGDRASSASFNVVSRLSDIGDILGGLRVIYSGIGPAIARVDSAQAAQTKRELAALDGYVAKLRQQERTGQAVHAAAGGRARPRGAGARDRDRRPGDAGRRTAQGQDRPVERCAPRPGSRSSSCGGLALAPAASAAPEPWEAAAAAREALSNAETELVLEGPAAAARYVQVASDATASVLAGRPAELAAARGALERARSAVARGDARAFAAARAECWTTIVRAAYLEADRRCCAR